MGLHYTTTLILLLGIGCQAVTGVAGAGMSVSWDIDGSNITFTTVCDVTTTNASGWWGWGINSSSTMVGADIYMFYKDGATVNRIVDSYATANSRPGTDDTSHVSIISHA